MTAIEIARRMAALGQTEDAVKAYTLALRGGAGREPGAELEAALYLLRNHGDYRVAYSTFVDLHRRGQYREECLSVLDQAFYQPNVKLLKSRYQNNRRLLEKYPYLFRRDFVDFEFLPVRFYPYDGHDGYVPYYPAEDRFGEYVNVRDTVISRSFFQDLEKPVLAADVFSQYELEYLNDNVRNSEDVGRENHIYLHYTDWAVFCSWLQVLNLRPLTEKKKAVFLFGDELSRYPIDFKAEFGVDYSQYPVKPVGLRELNRLIWHTQLATHNGGDFFNEIFDGHPNLLCQPSLLLSEVEESIADIREGLGKAQNAAHAVKMFEETLQARVTAELYNLGSPTDKDILAAVFLGLKTGPDYNKQVDWASRIVPAIFFQPHFHNVEYSLRVTPDNRSMLCSEEYDHIRSSPIFQGFKYVKTFTPLRSPSTSYGATVKFMYNSVLEKEREEAERDGKKERGIVNDCFSVRILNRSFLRNRYDRLSRDSVIVRFEDGKLNPRATFTALAAFLDLPYTESMTYCSMAGERDPESLKGNDRGFSTAAVYRAYDEYANDTERYCLEYLMRDAYEFYGYDFHYYDGAPLDEARLEELYKDFTTIDHYMRETWLKCFREVQLYQNGERIDRGVEEDAQDELLNQYMDYVDGNRLENMKILLKGLRFVNRSGQPLEMTPKLQLDPALLEQPLYH